MSNPAEPAAVVVLVSGAGTNLQALIDASADPSYGARVVAVGADRDGIEGLARAQAAGIATFALKVKDFATVKSGTRRSRGPWRRTTPTSSCWPAS